MTVRNRGSCLLIVMILGLVLLVIGFFAYRYFLPDAGQREWKKMKDGDSNGSGADSHCEVQVERSYFYTIGSKYYLTVEWTVRNIGTAAMSYNWRDKYLQIYFNPKNVVLGSPDSTHYPPSTGGDSGELPPGNVSKMIKTDYILGKEYFEPDFSEKIFWGVFDPKTEKLVFRIRLTPENKASATPQFITPDSGGGG